jgi:hypothetical protein
MGQDPPGWYYVGNGQLRYKFGDFWTDQYKTIDHSEPAVLPAGMEPSNPAPAQTSSNVSLPHLRPPRLMIAVCACLLGLGVGGGLLKPDIRHEWVAWAAAQASQLSALISRPAPPTPATTRDALGKTDARANANANARADARAAAKVKSTPRTLDMVRKFMQLEKAADTLIPAGPGSIAAGQRLAGSQVEL